MLSWFREDRRKTQALSLEVIARAQELARQRTLGLKGEMSAAEARGYVRARAAVVVGNATDQVLREQSRSVSRSVRNQVFATALESVVAWVVELRYLPAPALKRAA